MKAEDQPCVPFIVVEFGYKDKRFPENFKLFFGHEMTLYNQSVKVKEETIPHIAHYHGFPSEKEE